MEKLPDITAFTYHSFMTPKGRYMEVHYGTVIETFYSPWDRLKVIKKNWQDDKDIVDGLMNLIKSHSKGKN